MSTKRSKEIQNLSSDELVTKIREIERQVFDARMKRVTGQLTDTASIWRFRKDLARMKTRQTALHKSVAPVAAKTAPSKEAKSGTSQKAVR